MNLMKSNASRRSAKEMEAGIDELDKVKCQPSFCQGDGSRNR